MLCVVDNYTIQTQKCSSLNLREKQWFPHFLDTQIYTEQMSKYIALLISLLIGQYALDQ